MDSVRYKGWNRAAHFDYLGGMRIDLRSDTLTKPSLSMREAMAKAEVGDDVYGEDPTINRLERVVAGLLAKPLALFVPSGTMANQLAIMVHCSPGDEVIVEASGHSFNFETGATAALGGVQVRPVYEDGGRGSFSGATLEAHIRSDHIAMPKTSLVCIENTANAAGGTLWPAQDLVDVQRVACAADVRVHVDGARLFNAAYALCTAEAAAHVPTQNEIEAKISWLAGFGDSVCICLSKGLGAPVGSVLAGDEAFIHRARRLRKQLGGGLRQAGILAAAGLYALEHNIVRLGEDHRKAQALAQGLQKIDGWSLADGTDAVDSNIVVAAVCSAEGAPLDALKVCAALMDADVLAHAFGADRVRFVTHLDVPDNAIEEVLSRVAAVDLSQCCAG